MDHRDPLNYFLPECSLFTCIVFPRQGLTELIADFKRRGVHFAMACTLVGDSNLGLTVYLLIYICHYFKIDESHCDRIYSSVTAFRSFRNDYVGKAASGLERILCRVLVKKIPGKHG